MPPVQRWNAAVETLKRPFALGYNRARCSFSIPITCSSLNRLLAWPPPPQANTNPHGRTLNGRQVQRGQKISDPVDQKIGVPSPFHGKIPLLPSGSFCQKNHLHTGSTFWSQTSSANKECLKREGRKRCRSVSIIRATGSRRHLGHL